MATRSPTSSNWQEHLGENSDLAHARSLVQQARVLARAQQDQFSEAEALYRLAELSYASGLSNEAFAVALEAHDLAHRCGADRGVGTQPHCRCAVSRRTTPKRWRRRWPRWSSTAPAANAPARACCSTRWPCIQHSLRDTDRAIVTDEAALMANKGQERPDLDAITLANMAKVRADRQENLLAVSLGESTLELAKQHAAEFVPEILARLGMAYVSLSTLDRRPAVSTRRTASSATARPGELPCRRAAWSPCASPAASCTWPSVCTMHTLRTSGVMRWSWPPTPG